VPTPIRASRRAPAVALVVTAALLAGACGGGGSHTYAAGTPAATGVAPDCSVVPLDLVTKMLDMPLTGPAPGARSDGVNCAFQHTKGGGSAPESVQIIGQSTPDTFAIVYNGLKSANNPVKKIHGWGDEAYAATVFSVVNINNFAVRKGKVAVLIQSTADYPKIRNLMKAVLAKL
jgi:hypothetical protein